MRAIETEYNGYKFRSRLEARWAVFFDKLGIKYEYEPEGFLLSDGTRYLPDFYLPESDTFFEVKGVMTDIDMRKIKQLIKDIRKPVAIGYSDFTFRACDYWPDGTNDEEPQYSLTNKSESDLVKCPVCGNYYFIGDCGVWGCRCCNAYDGDRYHNVVCEGDLRFTPEPEVKEAITKAKQARFEHGEKP